MRKRMQQVQVLPLMSMRSTSLSICSCLFTMYLYCDRNSKQAKYTFNGAIISMQSLYQGQFTSAL